MFLRNTILIASLFAGSAHAAEYVHVHVEGKLQEVPNAVHTKNQSALRSLSSSLMGCSRLEKTIENPLISRDSHVSIQSASSGCVVEYLRYDQWKYTCSLTPSKGRSLSSEWRKQSEEGGFYGPWTQVEESIFLDPGTCKEEKI